MDSVWGVYLGIIGGIYSSTTLLILSTFNWGKLPHLYVQLIIWLQNKLDFDENSELSDNNNGPSIFCQKTFLTAKTIEESPATSDAFVMVNHLLTSGIQCILQDDLTRPFTSAPTQRWTMMSVPDVRKMNTKILLYSVYILGLLFRWTILFPLRLMFLLTAIAWVIVSGVICYSFPLHRTTIMYCGMTFARLFNASTGLVTLSHQTHNKPKASGIAVSNHLSANDIMLIYSDCDYDGVGYTVTGQIHKGLIECLQKFGSGLTPTLWLDRNCSKDRFSFQKQVLNYSSRKDVYPILLFPEGYCTNNDVVLQFRKAVFTGGVPIYPIALQQNHRVGDAFWKEDTYIPYMLRVMSSWATFYDIIYLPTMEKHCHEDDMAFSSRVQREIANAISKEALPYDGGLKREKDRLKYKEKIQNVIYRRLVNQ